jgi:hypothetical protein
MSNFNFRNFKGPRILFSQKGPRLFPHIPVVRPIIESAIILTSAQLYLLLTQANTLSVVSFRIPSALSATALKSADGFL